MQDTELGAVQARFAELIWANAPIGSGELVKLCENELNWKKPTTYTVLHKLCERGLFRNENAVVTPIVSREEYYSRRSRSFVESAFEGSLPAFISAFISGKGMTAEEAEQIHRMIEEYRNGGGA